MPSITIEIIEGNQVNFRQKVVEMKTGMAIKLDKAEEAALEKMVKVGLSPSKDEAARAAIIKYASDMGIFSSQMLWRKITDGGIRRCIF